MPERYWLTFTTRHRHGPPTQDLVYYQREGVDRWRLYYGKAGKRRNVGTDSTGTVEWQVDLARGEGRFIRHERGQDEQGRMFNPLVLGFSPGAIAANIRRELHRGVDQVQAVAIALDTARRAYRSRHPRGGLPAHLRRRSNPAMPRNPLYGPEAGKVMRRMDAAQRQLDLASRQASASDDPEVRHYARKRREKLLRELARLSNRLHNPAEIAKLQAAMLREEARYDRTSDLYRYDDRMSAKTRVMKAAGHRDRAQKAVYDAMRRGANPADVRNVERVWGSSGWEWTAFGYCGGGRSTNGWGSTRAAAIADLERQCRRLANPFPWPFRRRRRGPPYRSLSEGQQDYDRLGPRAYWAQFGREPQAWEEGAQRRRRRRRNPMGMGHGELVDVLVPVVALFLLMRSGVVKASS